MGTAVEPPPHIHCLVTAGGITRANDWKKLAGDYLLPVRVVKALYRGKLQAYIKAAVKDHDLILPRGVSENEVLSCINRLYKKPWSVRIQERYEHAKGVILYLARYVKGGPLHPQQIISCGNKIRFLYKDHRDQKVKTLCLKVDEFMRRILWHVPKVGIHVVRHYGLYASRSQDKRDRCREEIGGIAEAEIKAGKAQESGLDWCCDQCGALLKRVFSVYRPGRYENPYNNECAVRTCVQQGAQAGLANVPQNGQSCSNAPPQLFFGGVRDRLA
ncbi:MAG: transposase [Gammaproteobacteria bacterium]|nr:transposase [Gammaproteobacteria bacterium]